MAGEAWLAVAFRMAGGGCNEGSVSIETELLREEFRETGLCKPIAEKDTKEKGSP
jgi:hypothetical protein